MTNAKQDQPTGVRYFRVRTVGNGLSVSLPREYTKGNHIEVGQYLKVMWEGPVLTVLPVQEERRGR